jgi:regulator of protease activity HflC (stomatin/prohibitin superfamily)
MKQIVALIFLMAVECGRSETNAVVFPALLSSTNSTLLSNAEFRRTFGSKVIFKSQDNLVGFEARSLHSNVLQRLGLTVEKLEADQAALDAKNRRLTQQELEQQKQQAILRNAQMAAQAQRNAEESQKQKAEAEARQKEAKENQQSQPTPPPSPKPPQKTTYRRMGY